MKTIKAFITWLLDLTICSKSEIKSLRRQLGLKDEIIEYSNRKISVISDRLQSVADIETNIASLTMRLQLAEESKKAMRDQIKEYQDDRIRIVAAKNGHIAEFIEKNNAYNLLHHNYHRALDEIEKLKAKRNITRDAKGRFTKK